MTKEISDEMFKSEMLEFKTEVMKFAEVASHKFDGLTTDIRSNAFKLDRLENGLNRVEGMVTQVEEKLDAVSTDLKLLTRQFNDVGAMAIKDSNRIDDLEKRVDVLETESH